MNMPLFDFKCPVCGNKFEHLAGNIDEMAPCECGATAVRLREIGTTRVQFDGSGWSGSGYDKWRQEKREPEE
jgi:putative FmdB family regulatory protein